MAFLSRHGDYHNYAPHEVPSRANIAALRHLGVRTIIAFSAVGSLQEQIKPRDFVVPDQIIDRTKGGDERGILGKYAANWTIRYQAFHVFREGNRRTRWVCGSI